MKNYIIFGVIAVIVIVGAMMYKSSQPAVVSGTVETDSVPAQPAVSGTVVTNPKPITMENGLIITDTKVGNGAEAKAGMRVTVHYVGTLTNGTQFDASRNHGTAGFTFNLGAGEVIQGWDLGVAGMKVGGTRTLTIPPALGYGAQNVGPIPANSTLNFTVELLAVR